MKKGKNYNKILKICSAAACLFVVLGVGVIYWNNKGSEFDTNSKDNIVVEGNKTVSTEQSKIQKEPESYIDVSMLLATNEGLTEQSLAFSCIEIGEYSAIYYKVESVDSSILKESIGSEVEGTKNWYKLSGHEDMQYLISYDKNEYSLWEFSFFQSESYAYSDVLKFIYHINSAEDIKEIIVTPANMDNTDKGKAIQKEIGKTTITEEERIEILYNVLSGLTCYGSNQWDRIGLGDDTPSAMLEQVRKGRYLTLVTTQKMKIDSLKYTGISGMFYEYSGIAFNALTPEEKSAIENILNIE